MSLLTRALHLVTSFPVPSAMPATKNQDAHNSDILDDASPEALEMKPVLAELLPQLLAKEYGTKLQELPAYQAIRAQNTAYQSRLVLALTAAIGRVNHKDDYRLRWDMAEVLTALLRTTLTLTEADYLRLFASYGLDFSKSGKVSLHVYPFPLLLTLSQVAKLAKRTPLGEPMLAFLRQLREHSAQQTGDLLKINLKAQEILGHATGGDELPTVVFASADPLGRALSQFVAGLAHRRLAGSAATLAESHRRPAHRQAAQRAGRCHHRPRPRCRARAGPRLAPATSGYARHRAAARVRLRRRHYV
jgi:hypothetical protein